MATATAPYIFAHGSIIEKFFSHHTENGKLSTRPGKTAEPAAKTGPLNSKDLQAALAVAACHSRRRTVGKT